ncbi:hypothetical protein RvY_12676 [Ramazzottius varieornatus]|uniref:SANT domain-containing protein n=1 Tax=Ramazzottius varieornatus TaxID=947166 RepID=A0A1D1VSX7_RAMVA|nr:hypothetical protein RvY_12676 [Ramazzottius varieornatus]
MGFLGDTASPMYFARSPTATHRSAQGAPAYHAPSAQQPLHHLSPNVPNNYPAGIPRYPAYDYHGASSSNMPVQNTSKKPRLIESDHHISQDPYSQPPRGSYGLSRPIPLEAISPPTADENLEYEVKLRLLRDEISVLDRRREDSERTLNQWEAELKSVEARKEEHDKAPRSETEVTKPDSPNGGVFSDMVRRIISENKKISEAEHKSATKKFVLPPSSTTTPKHPCDLGDIMQVLRDYQRQRPSIISRLKKDRQAKQIRERYLKERYKQLTQAYVDRRERIEGNPKRKAREVKLREYYERQFPELKKMRDDKKNRLKGGNDEVDGASTLSGSEESDMEKFQRNAVLVPMLLDAKDRSRHFFDRNRLSENVTNEYKESITSVFWTQEEKDIFKEKYLQRPKDFLHISSFLRRKSVQDCVQHYYLTKRKENYKQLVKKQKAYKIRRGPNKRIQSMDDSLKLVNASAVSALNPMSATSIRLSSVHAELRGAEAEREEVSAVSSMTIVCPARKCQARRRVIKRLFKAPVDVTNFAEIFKFIELSETATSCCKYCVSFLERRLGLRKWSTTEVEALKKGLATHGSNWTLIAKLVATKRLRDCVQYYKRHCGDFMGIGSGLVQLPNAAADEYSPFSDTSSSEDEGGEALPSPIKVEETTTTKRNRTTSEDSNATLSADEMDENEEKAVRFMTTLPKPLMTENSFNPGQLPMFEGLGSRISSPYAPSPDQRQGPNNGPACVRDLIHSAIVKNLDKDKSVVPAQMPEDFKRRLASTASNLGNGRRNDVDVAFLARTVEDSSSRPPSNHLHPRSASGPNPTPKSPNRPELVPPPSASPSRRDLSPHIDDKNRLIRSPAAPAGQVHANYQFSNRQSLSADFQTARQMHVEQGASGQSGQQHPQENGQSGLRQFEQNQQQQQPQPGVLPAGAMQVDPRFLQSLYGAPYLYMAPQGMPYTPMLTPEYMEALAAAGYLAQPVQGLQQQQHQAQLQQAQSQQSQGSSMNQGGQGRPAQGNQPGRSIVLGTGRPGVQEDPQSAPGDSASRLQTLAQNRGMLREMGTPGSSSNRRGKPDIITIDDSRREPPSPNSMTDMRFRPGPHPMVKQENMNDKEPDPSLTAGSLIDVIITRQISSASGRADQPGQPGGGTSQSGSTAQRSAQHQQQQVPKRGEADPHKPFTLGEHIEQIITNDFSRKDNLSSPVGGTMVGAVGMVGFPQFQQRMDASWKRRMRMDEVGPAVAGNQVSPPQTMYNKPPSTQPSTVEYEPISPPEREASESGEDSQDNCGTRRPGL